ncbi:DUF6378 domain-containing protein [Pseudoramibacter alactolyticus]|uniref:DUF6378 domain-containing protein n=1 Tax=Pseudoramibacter alactolyticus TaxID=113287 RepID=UPI0028EED392|nr:DUF6378 domain-containing protein [Pseudoramibacter alactolyticus]
MKIYISQSIVGKTAEEYSEEYRKERKEIIRQLKTEYGDDVEIVGSYRKDKWQIIDKAFFVPGWQDDDGCIKEHEECTRRGIEIIYDGVPKATEREKLLDEAKRIVCGDRDRQYGKPEYDFEKIAKLWECYLIYPISKGDVAMMMILLKVAREGEKHKHDNLVDIVGYAACAAECENYEDEEK